MRQEIDLINEEDEVVGVSDVDEVHKKNLLHRAVHVFIVNSKGELFCRQRNRMKTLYPGFWSTSVGAHVLSGQNYEDVAHESLENMLGIHCELELIGKDRVQDETENEIVELFIGNSDDNMSFNPRQVEDGKFLSVEEVEELTKQENATPHLAKALEIYLDYKNKNL
ncbi:MAG: NUDIX domain-containing protein [Candidatus Diapherotrites archaeon]|nr:NUDIX domain-containing protein [Candidatus Diapherotrites archaeon]